VSDSENFGRIGRFNILILESRITSRSISEYAEWRSIIFNESVIEEVHSDPSYPRVEDNL
jgi:hypothetical protein